MSDTPVFGPDDHVDDVEALIREIDADDLDLVAPPADVWDGIEAAIDRDRSTGRSSDVVSLTDRRSRFSTRFLAAAAAIVVVAAGVAVVSSIRDSDDGDVVATADLAYDAEAFDPLGADASATARLVERDGRFEIQIDRSSLPNDLGEPADLELWLIETDPAGAIVDIAPISLVDGDGTYAVPSSVDVSTHRIVDISIEPRDGDDTHSSRSILRGELDA